MTAPVSKNYKSFAMFNEVNPTYGHPDDGNDASANPFQGVDNAYRNYANAVDKPYRGPVGESPRSLQEAMEEDESGLTTTDGSRRLGEPDAPGSNPDGEPSEEALKVPAVTGTKSATPSRHADKEEVLKQQADDATKKELTGKKEASAEVHNAPTKKAAPTDTKKNE